MDTIFLLISYSMAAVIIGFAIYFLYCWNRDQLQDDMDDEQEASGFDVNSIDKS